MKTVVGELFKLEQTPADALPLSVDETGKLNLNST